MTFQVSEKVMRKAIPHLTMVSVLVVLSLCMTSMAYTTAPAVKTYPVTVTASPKSQSIAPGGTANVKFTEKNGGSSAFMVTGCVLEDATSSGGPYTNIGCTISAPYTIPAHGTVKITGSITASTTAAPGKYYFRFYDTGKVGSTAEDTKMASFTITIT
jgi:hypothetical protein